MAREELICCRKPIPNLHALVIGIDTYPKVTPLSGAVADADSIDWFLRTDLGVPPAQIINLRNEKATRSAVVAAFRALRDNPAIKPLDPIVVYYAGHGSEVDTPSGLKNNGSKTQCVVPWDVGMLDDSGVVIGPIPDYITAAGLYAIAEQKGNNLVSAATSHYIILDIHFKYRQSSLIAAILRAARAESSTLTNFHSREHSHFLLFAASTSRAWRLHLPDLLLTSLLLVQIASDTLPQTASPHWTFVSPKRLFQALACHSRPESRSSAACARMFY